MMVGVMQCVDKDGDARERCSQQIRKALSELDLAIKATGGMSVLEPEDAAILGVCREAFRRLEALLN